MDRLKKGDIAIGRITGIQSYGAFMQFENGQQGLIHISEISSRFVKNVGDFVKIGQPYRVKVIEVDEKNDYLKLSLKQVLERERQVIRKPLRVSKPRRTKIYTTEKDFEVLRNHLDEWIEKTLKEM